MNLDNLLAKTNLCGHEIPAVETFNALLTIGKFIDFCKFGPAFQQDDSMGKVFLIWNEIYRRAELPAPPASDHIVSPRAQDFPALLAAASAWLNELLTTYDSTTPTTTAENIK